MLIPTMDSNLVQEAVRFFLMNQRKDLDAAEAMFQRAIEANPDDAVNLGSYALFLWDSHHDAQAADDAYRKAMSADPLSMYCTALYAEFLFERGLDEETEALGDLILRVG